MAFSDKWFSRSKQVFWCVRTLIEDRTIPHRTEMRETKGWRFTSIFESLNKKCRWPIAVKMCGADQSAHNSLGPKTHFSTLIALSLATAVIDKTEPEIIAYGPLVRSWRGLPHG